MWVIKPKKDPFFSWRPVSKGIVVVFFRVDNISERLGVIFTFGELKNRTVTITNIHISQNLLKSDYIYTTNKLLLIYILIYF